MQSTLQKFKAKNAHRVIFIHEPLRGGKGAWLAFRRDDGTMDLLSFYCRKRDAFRALRKEGYLQHGSSWSLPSTMKETMPIHPEETARKVLVLQSGEEPQMKSWPFE